MIAAKRRLFLLAVIGAFSWVSGCLSPTLPLPPPNRPDVSAPNEAGYVTLSGTVPAKSRALAFHEESGVIAGQQTDETGRYELELRAESDDVIVFWYETGTEASQIVWITVPRVSP